MLQTKHVNFKFDILPADMLDMPEPSRGGLGFWCMKGQCAFKQPPGWDSQ